MRFGRRLLVVASLCVMVGGPVAGTGGVLTAHADNQVQQCTLNATWSFSPQLTSFNQSGTITATYSGSCTDAAYFNDWYGQGVETGSGASQWTNSYPYYGSCLGANFSYGYNYSTGYYEGSGYLAGGTVAYATSGNSNYASALESEVTTLATTNPCNEGTGLGTSTAQGEEAW